MQVIRCEPRDKPYDPFCSTYRLLPEAHKKRWQDLPVPGFEDRSLPVLSVGDPYMCAALPHQLDSWFPPDLREYMRAIGRRFVILDVPDEHVMFGSHQVLVDRDMAVIVEEYPH
jgi:hypothetical protein